MQDEAEFAEAARSWNLEKLYTDLASAKGRGLTPVEKQHLQGLLCGYSPNEIASKLGVSPQTVRTSLSKGLYRYIEELLIRQARNTLKVKDWSRVASLLEQAGYKRESSFEVSPLKPHLGETDFTFLSNADKAWDRVPDVSVFYGRVEELATLERWIIQDSCRLVALWGIGGIGKTALAAKLAQQIRDQFERVVWRSLRGSPPIQEFLRELLLSLSIQPELEASATPEIQRAWLMEYFHRHRCVLILEDVQMVLSSGELVGQYQVGYEGYGELLRRVGEERHRSCLLLTGWEKPREVTLLEGQTQPIRSLKLEGLGVAAKAILEEKGLAELELWEELSRPYRGNPWALKSISTTIQELFDGSIAEFLNQNTLFLGDIEYLLYQQFKRLSELETKIICTLAAEGKEASLSQLQGGIQFQASRSELMKAVQSLERRSLIEQMKAGGETLFTLQPVVMKYALSQNRCG